MATAASIGNLTAASAVTAQAIVSAGPVASAVGATTAIRTAGGMALIAVRAAPFALRGQPHRELHHFTSVLAGSAAPA